MAAKALTVLDDARAFANANSRRGGLTCTYCHLPDEDRQAADALRKEGVAHRVIARWLKERRGHDMTYHKVQHHFENHVERG
jgi:hypothetical protein